MKRALIVDDEPELRHMLSRFLGISGWDAVAVASAAEALDAFKVGRFSFVISDVDLGAVDGIALAWKLRALEPTLRIALMSGSSTAHADQAKAAGLGPILSKPFDLKEIVDRL
jgi:DNA-binding response OmpR family regulator